MSAEFPPRETCQIRYCAGVNLCACGWSDHPMMEDYPCLAALEDEQDRVIREDIEGGKDWRPPEHFLNENRKEKA